MGLRLPSVFEMTSGEVRKLSDIQLVWKKVARRAIGLKIRRTTTAHLLPSPSLRGPGQSQWMQVADKLLGQTLFKLPHDRRDYVRNSRCLPINVDHFKYAHLCHICLVDPFYLSIGPLVALLYVHELDSTALAPPSRSCSNDVTRRCVSHVLRTVS